VLSPVLAELLQLPTPWPPHPAAPQGGLDASAAFTASTANGQAAYADTPAAEPFAVAAEAAGSQHNSRGNEDENCDEVGSWFAPQTAVRLVDLFHSLAGDRGCLLPADLVR
jgi:hypothetical protein